MLQFSFVLLLRTYLIFSSSRDLSSRQTFFVSLFFLFFFISSVIGLYYWKYFNVSHHLKLSTANPSNVFRVIRQFRKRHAYSPPYLRCFASLSSLFPLIFFQFEAKAAKDTLDLDLPRNFTNVYSRGHPTR